MPAFLMGLGISAVAGLVYVIAWEITLGLTDYAFVDAYSAAMVDAAREKGVSGEELAAVAAKSEEFRQMYLNPLFRLPVSFVEIFPVGLVISLIAAALLRNPRFMPRRA
jgi:hypothetical protein